MKIVNSVLDLYSTKDIYLASALVASGFQLEDITKQEKQFTFLFKLSKEIEYAVSDYWSGTLQSVAKDLFSAFRDIKSRMYNQDYDG